MSKGLYGCLTLAAIVVWWFAGPIVVRPVMQALGVPADLFIPILIGWYVVGIPSIWVGSWLWSRREWGREAADPRELRDSLVPLLARLREEAPRLGTTGEDRRAARDYEKGRGHFAKGVAALDEADALGEGRRGRSRLARALKELRSAERDVLAASAVLDRAGPSTAQAPLEAGASVRPIGPRPTFRECCFFCSRPLPPVNRRASVIDISRQRREVTACRSHGPEEGGAPPLIKAVDRGGVAVPWFAIADYEPYRDYTPTYSLGLAADALPAEFLDAALGLSHAVAHRPADWYADDDWDWDYRTRYWDTTHQRWEHEGGWEAHGAAPETPLAMGAAPETSFGNHPTAAETAFAAGLGLRQPGRAAGGGRAEMDVGGGGDRS